jgi:hypothetical protein
MKFIVFIFLLLPLMSKAQYLEVDFADGELDPAPLVKDMGAPPTIVDETMVKDNNRSPAKEGVSRAPAIIDNPLPVTQDR